ncbi:MAG: porin [Deltaproteobacteria bacterium]|nr:porin [Deltaproteobacteria bacterium]MBW1792870.1 porin [Deltaproteobacteria bacterium]
MKKLAVLGKMVIVLLFVCGMTSPSWAGIKIEIDEQTKGEVGIWMQTWYQYVEDGKNHGKINEEDLNDFMIRRAYMYLKGQVTDLVSFFTHVASDRVGQEGLDKSGLGLGSGVAWRDLWITLNLHEALKIQMGRMYVPLTRNYGTTSTKCMLTTDLPFLQGGVRSNIFYAQKVGRDDSVTIWGNPLDGLLQYRFMVSEGVEGKTENEAKTVVINDNPEDNLRFVGRLSLSLLEPETSWFNKGTYLGKKKVLSFGFGMDSQDDLTLNDRPDEDNFVWTLDAFFDHPVGAGAITVEAAYIDINNCTQNHNYSELKAGDDAENWYINAGYLLPGSIGPGRLQPFIRYETVDVDKRDVDKDYETDVWTAGLNYVMKGHNCKITADYTNIDQDSDASRDDQDIVTFQITIGF